MYDSESVIIRLIIVTGNLLPCSLLLVREYNLRFIRVLTPLISIRFFVLEMIRNILLAFMVVMAIHSIQLDLIS